MNATVTGELVPRGHQVSFDGYRFRDEQFYPHVLAEWRGKAVKAEMEARRYASSDGIVGPWQVFVRRATERREGDDLDGFWYGPEVSDTACSRLREVCAPVVLEWLESDAYAPSRRRAFAFAIRAQLREDAGGIYGTAARDTLELLHRFGDELGRTDYVTLNRGCELVAALAEVLNAVPSEEE